MAETLTIRESQRALMSRRRAAERDLKLTHVEDEERRSRALDDVFVFLETYFPDLFDEPWTDNRRDMVNSIFETLQTRTAQAIAAPRGEGKSTITTCVMAYCICRGLVKYAVIVAATDKHATDKLLENLKAHFERNELLLGDFPEICVPVRDVCTSPNKAGSQTVDGVLTNIEWSADCVVFPTVDGSKASGIVVEAKGITSATRGMNKYGRRPDLVVIDDPDDEESAESDSSTERRVRKINRSISGLAKRTRGIGRVMLCTLINTTCVAAQYTDRKKNPAWNGRRYRALDAWPVEADLWADYVTMRKEDQDNGDRHARRAHGFYLQRRAVMDAGAVVTNPYSYDPSLLPDGTKIEESALQACYNIIADRGIDTFLTEFQNDPPDQSIADVDRLTAFKVRGSAVKYEGRVTGMARGVVPDDAIALTATVDVQKRWLFFEVVAWLPGRRRHVVDYGRFGDGALADRIGISEAIRIHLRELRDAFEFGHDDEFGPQAPYADNDGRVFPLNMVLVDSSYEPPTVWALTERFGWRSAMGDPQYHHPKTRTNDRRPSTNGDRWYESRQRMESGRFVLQVNMETVFWKHRCHDSWTIPPKGAPEGSVTLFGDNPRQHAEFSEQMVAEEWREVFEEEKGTKMKWVPIRHDNHYLDCDYMQFVAASMCGVWRHTLKSARPEKKKLSEIQAAKRARV